MQQVAFYLFAKKLPKKLKYFSITDLGDQINTLKTNNIKEESLSKTSGEQKLDTIDLLTDEKCGNLFADARTVDGLLK